MWGIYGRPIANDYVTKMMTAAKNWDQPSKSIIYSKDY